MTPVDPQQFFGEVLILTIAAFGTLVWWLFRNVAGRIDRLERCSAKKTELTKVEDDMKELLEKLETDQKELITDYMNLGERSRAELSGRIDSIDKKLDRLMMLVIKGSPLLGAPDTEG